MDAKLVLILNKDISVGSVHIDTALGNEKKRPKSPKAGELDFEAPFKVEKMAPDQRLIFGWASVVEKNGSPVVDKHGDIIPVDVLEGAAYNFMLYSRENDDLHLGEPTGRCVESMMFTPEKAKLGLVAKNSQGEQIYGLWTGFYIDSDPLWEAHKRGERPELSIGGLCSKTQLQD